MRVLVMGAGAIGSVFGGLLAQAGHAVTLLGRAAHMEAIRAQGLAIGGIWGEHLVRSLVTVTSISELSPPPPPFDAVLITTKSYDTEAAVCQALPFLGPSSLVVSLQNGLGNLETIAEIAGPERAVGGRVIFGVDLVEPGRVVVTVFGGDVMLGSPGNADLGGRIKELASASSAAGIPTQATENIQGFIWGKVLYNGSLNALSALLGVPYGALLETEATRDLMTSLIRETFAVARAEGAPLPWDEPEQYRRALFEELIPATAAHFASTHADLRRGRRTEIDSLNGAVVRLGRLHGVPTPVNSTLTLLIAAAERRGSPLPRAATEAVVGHAARRRALPSP